jgi:hypothetical protein
MFARREGSPCMPCVHICAPWTFGQCLLLTVLTMIQGMSPSSGPLNLLEVDMS